MTTRRTSWPYLYIAITLGLTWSYTAYLLGDPANRLDMFVFAMLIPGLVAIILCALQYRSVKRLVEPIVGRFQLPIYLFSVWYPLAFIGACGLISWLSQLARLDGERLGTLASLPGPIELTIGLVLLFGEEYGWRGYLLPELRRQHGLMAAVMTTGIVWALFHAPMVYALAAFSGTGNPILVCGVQMAAVFTFSFPFAYIFLMTGSIIPPIIFHLVWNIYNPIVLGSIYRNESGIINGNILLINGEAVMGVLLGLVFVLWFVRNRSGIAKQIEMPAHCFESPELTEELS